MLKLTTSEYLRTGSGTIHRRAGDDDSRAWGVRPDPGFEIAPTAESLARARRWRQARDMPSGRHPAARAGAASTPAESDAVLAAALRMMSAATDADLGGEKKTPGHADEAAGAGL
jgi:hypothetical protein